MTKRQSIADWLRAKGFPTLSEEQYQDNIRALVPTVCFCEETAMTTDLSNKSVEEVLTDVIEFFKQDLSDGHAWDFVEDVRPLIARRLEEAQKKIISHQAKSRRIGKWVSAALDDPTVCEEMKADINFFMLDDFASDDFSAIAANNAKVAAEAKAEALEERAAVYEAEPYPESEYYATDLRAKAAEYRAKAAESGRKE